MARLHSRYIDSPLLSSTLCPFLYQTQTLRRALSTVPRLHLEVSTSRSQQATPIQSDGSQTIPRPTSLDSTRKSNFLHAKRQEVESKRKKAPTITPEEREIFDQIARKFGGDVPKISALGTNAVEDNFKTLEDAIAKPLKSPSKLSAKQSELYNTDIDRILSLFAPQNSVSVTSSFSTFNAEDAENETETDTSLNPDAPQPYPAHRVREAALTALEQFSQSVQTTISSPSAVVDTPPDLLLWHLLETDIFPLIKLLQQPWQQPAKLSSNSASTQQESQPQSTFSALHRLTISSIPEPYLPQPLHTLPPATPLLPLLTLLYPTTILLALRTLATHHPTSPYIPSLLPRLRSLGPTSYLLAACNAHFANTLLTIHWTIYSDMQAVDRILRDLKQDGVAFNDTTLSIIDHVRADRDADFTSPVDERVRSLNWWKMPGQVELFKKLDVFWRERLVDAIEERRIAEDRRIRQMKEQELEEDEVR